MLLGEKMSEGALMYKNIEDYTAPFSALTYSLINSLFGHSHSAYVFFSMLFIFAQVVIFSIWLNRLGILKEKTYVSALVYILVSCMNLEFYSLSPELMGMTFLLLALFQVFFIMKFGSQNEYELSSGIYLGIATLFYFPYLLFGLLAIIILAMYSSIKLQKGLVFIFGIFFPIFLVGIFFYWKGSLNHYLIDLLFYSLGIFKRILIDPILLIKTFGIILVLTALAIVKTLSHRGFVNYQQKVQVSFVMWLIVAFVIILIIPKLYYSTALLVLPPVAFFITNWLVIIRKDRIKELIGVVIIGALVFAQFSYTRSLKEKVMNVSNYGKVLLLDEHLSVFQNENNKPATRFINWRMAKRYFIHPEKQANQILLLDAIESDLPDVIIDPENVCPKVFEYIIPLREKYLKQGEGLYILKPL